jgi:hypothetical protein
MPRNDPLVSRGAALLRGDAAEASRNERECSHRRTGPVGAKEAWTSATTGAAGSSRQVLVPAVAGRSSPQDRCYYEAGAA